MLWILDHKGAKTAEIERGVKAAMAIFEAAGLSPVECQRADMLLCEDEPHDEVAAATWVKAERAAIAACCAGWQRIPESIHLECEQPVDVVPVSVERQPVAQGLAGFAIRPTPSAGEVRAAREAAGLSLAGAAGLVGLGDRKRWHEYETGQHKIAPATWALFLLLIGQHPELRVERA